MIIRKTLVTICLVFTFLFSSGQKSDVQIDSLRGLLRHKSGPDRVDIFFELSFNQVEINNDTALRYGLEGYRLAIKLNDSLRIVRTGMVTASALRRLQRIDSSIVVYHAILPLAEKKGYTEELALLLNSLGIAYTYKAQYDRALNYYFESLRLRESVANKRSKIPVLENIALLYYKLKDYEKALEIFLECLELTNKTGVHEHDDLLLINIGHCYAYLGDFINAAFYIDQGLQFCAEACSPQRIMEANFAKGIMFYCQKDYRKAEQYFLISYSIAKTGKNIRFQLDNIDYLSQLYIDQSQISAAAYYQTEAEKLISQNGSFNLERIKIYSRSSQLFLATRSFEKATEYQFKYGQLKDSVYSEEMTRNLMKAEAEFQERENAARILAQNEVIALKEEIIGHQDILYKIAILLFFFFVGFVIVLFRSYRQRKAINAVLEKKIIERTHELEVSRDKWLKAFQERDLLLVRTWQAIGETIRHINGLCFLTSKEVSDPLAHSYFERIHTASGRLSHLVQSEYHDNLIA
ncbi:MAG: tetratricopeptide repeat protein [Cyclobacteriaceae bacterium]